MDNYSNNIVFVKEKNKKLSDKFKFGLSIFIIILFGLSIPFSFVLKTLLHVPQLTKDEAINLIYSDWNFTLNVNKAISNNATNNKEIYYITSLTTNNFNKINKKVYVLNIDTSINYTDIEIDTNCNVIFKYIDNNWTITDITNIKEENIRPGVSAGTYILNKINNDLNTKGYFEFNGIKNRFNTQTFSELTVINEYGTPKETTVHLGRYNENPYVTAILSFNYDTFQWELKSLSLR